MFIFVPSLCVRYSYANGGLRVDDKPTLSKMSIDSKNLRCLPGTPSKRTQHFRPTVRNIVGCYKLGPFAHPVAVVACCWELLRKVRRRSNFSAGNSHLFFFCSVIAEA